MSPPRPPGVPAYSSQCCPVAQVVYAGYPNHRCCSPSFLNHPPLNELRPRGGKLWPEAGSALTLEANHASVLLLGDSMLEQTFVGLLCQALASRGHSVANLTRWSGTQLNEFWGGGLSRGAKANPRAYSAIVEPHGLEINYVFTSEIDGDLVHLTRVHKRPATCSSNGTAHRPRCPTANPTANPHPDPTAAPNHPFSQSGTRLVLGGFTWKLPAEARLSEALRLTARRWPALLANRTVVLEQIPNHFPKGVYRGSVTAKYPKHNSNHSHAKCDQVASYENNRRFNSSDWLTVVPGHGLDPSIKAQPHVRNEQLPAFNRMLARVVRRHGMRLGVVQLAEAYALRGDAKIGMFSAGGARDCQHLCVEGLDGMATVLLSVLSAVCGPAAPGSSR